jgi:hypothetical protein
MRPHEKNGRTGISIGIKWDERVAGWARQKMGKLEIQGGKFKSFTGDVANVCKNFEKISTPVQTYADAMPSMNTKSKQSLFESSASWKYLVSVAAGQDPDISASAASAPKVKVTATGPVTVTPARGSTSGTQPAVPTTSNPKGTRSRQPATSAPKSPTSRAGRGTQDRRSASTRPPTAPAGALDLDDVMEGIGVPPESKTDTESSAKQRRQGSAQQPTDRPRVGNAAQSANKAKRKTPKPSGTQSNWSAGPKVGSASRVRTRGTEN